MKHGNLGKPQGSVGEFSLAMPYRDELTRNDLISGGSSLPKWIIDTNLCYYDQHPMKQTKKSINMTLFMISQYKIALTLIMRITAALNWTIAFIAFAHMLAHIGC